MSKFVLAATVWGLPPVTWFWLGVAAVAIGLSIVMLLRGNHR